MTRAARLVGGGLLAGLVAAEAPAATICVDPGGAGGCETTIQAAVNRAAAGDVIRIGPGVYYEGVVVRPDQLGLQIVGSGRASILDGSPYLDRGFAGVDTTLVVEAADVRVSHVRFRNGGFGIRVLGVGGAILEGLWFDGTDVGISIEAPHVRVLSSAFFDCFTGVLVQAADADVRGSRFERGHGGIAAEKTLRPDRPRVVGNRMAGVREPIALGSIVEPLVRSNTVVYSLGGVEVAGPNPVVERNVVGGGGSGGIFAFCSDVNLFAGPGDDVPAECSRASVAFNTVRDAAALAVGSVAPGMVVRGNTLRGGAIGMSVHGSDVVGEAVPIVVERNRVTDVGFVPSAPILFRPCFDLSSSGALLSGNTAIGCADGGFRVEGRENRLASNRALDTHGNGFTVAARRLPDGTSSSAANTLEGNTSRSNAAAGFAVLDQAELTALVGNLGLGNRTDFCDEGIDTVLSGNTFGTTGPCSLLR